VCVWVGVCRCLFMYVYVVYVCVCMYVCLCVDGLCVCVRVHVCVCLFTTRSNVRPAIVCLKRHVSFAYLIQHLYKTVNHMCLHM
jgi:hypothetical protein